MLFCLILYICLFTNVYNWVKYCWFEIIWNYMFSNVYKWVKSCYFNRLATVGKMEGGELAPITLPQPSTDLPDIAQFLSIYMSEEDSLALQEGRAVGVGGVGGPVVVGGGQVMQHSVFSTEPHHPHHHPHHHHHQHLHHHHHPQQPPTASRDTDFSIMSLVSHNPNTGAGTCMSLLSLCCNVM